jgi:hypothetical protein
MCLLVFVYRPVILFGNLAYEAFSLVLQYGAVEKEVGLSFGLRHHKGTPGILLF